MKSKRLTYRPLDFSDAARVAELAGDWDVARMTSRIPYPYTLTQAHRWISGLDGEEFVRVVELDGRMIGAVGYVRNADGSAEIGYWIGRPWWGLGYATEAAEALVAYCFGACGFQRLTCCHYIDNFQSQRVIKRLGFRLMARGEAWCEARGEAVATLRYERKRSVISRLLGRRAA